MTRSLLCLIAAMLLAILPATDSAAAVFSRDWQTPGDGLLTYDDVNQREWLDLTETLLVKFPNLSVSDVINELEPGGKFDGFAIGTSTEVTSLAESAGINTGSLDYVTNSSSTQHLIDLLTPTFSTNFAVGYVENLHTAFLLVISPTSSISDPTAGLIIGSGAGGDLRRPASTGVMLYRPVVPEPTSATLCVVGALNLICHFRCRNSLQLPENPTSLTIDEDVSMALMAAGMLWRLAV